MSGECGLYAQQDGFYRDAVLTVDGKRVYPNYCSVLAGIYRIHRKDCRKAHDDSCRL